jgi:hypothetical protein
MQIVGGFLVCVGCLFIVIGALTVFAQMLQAFRNPGQVKERGIASDDINAIATLLDAIGKLPSYIVTTLLGMLLIAAGQHMIAGLLLTRP